MVWNIETGSYWIQNQYALVCKVVLIDHDEDEITYQLCFGEYENEFITVSNEEFVKNFDRWRSFDEWMKDVYKRLGVNMSDSEKEKDPYYFLYTEKQIKDDIDHFKFCWANGMSTYKALVTKI
jgi:hypothetical protein